MLEIQGDKIILSRGDTLEVTFTVEGYIILPGDVVEFCVKKKAAQKEAVVMSKTINNVENNTVSVLIGKDITAGLEPGIYAYDLVCTSGEKRVTLNFPNCFVIREVVHNVQQ